MKWGGVWFPVGLPTEGCVRVVSPAGGLGGILLTVLYSSAPFESKSVYATEPVGRL